eukprot:12493577-Prorocentrum_lima.AAC.1
MGATLPSGCGPTHPPRGGGHVVEPLFVTIPEESTPSGGVNCLDVCPFRTLREAKCNASGTALFGSHASGVLQYH